MFPALGDGGADAEEGTIDLTAGTQSQGANYPGSENFDMSAQTTALTESALPPPKKKQKRAGPAAKQSTSSSQKQGPKKKSEAQQKFDALNVKCIEPSAGNVCIELDACDAYCKHSWKDKVKDIYNIFVDKGVKVEGEEEHVQQTGDRNEELNADFDWGDWGEDSEDDEDYRAPSRSAEDGQSHCAKTKNVDLPSLFETCFPPEIVVKMIRVINASLSPNNLMNEQEFFLFLKTYCALKRLRLPPVTGYEYIRLMAINKNSAIMELKRFQKILAALSSTSASAKADFNSATSNFTSFFCNFEINDVKLLKEGDYLTMDDHHENMKSSGDAGIRAHLNKKKHRQGPVASVLASAISNVVLGLVWVVKSCVTSVKEVALSMRGVQNFGCVDLQRYRFWYDRGYGGSKVAVEVKQQNGDSTATNNFDSGNAFTTTKPSPGSRGYIQGQKYIPVDGFTALYASESTPKVTDMKGKCIGRMLHLAYRDTGSVVSYCLTPGESGSLKDYHFDYITKKGSRDLPEKLDYMHWIDKSCMLLTCGQGSREWFYLRLFYVTSSVVGKMISIVRHNCDQTEYKDLLSCIYNRDARGDIVEDDPYCLSAEEPAKDNAEASNKENDNPNTTTPQENSQRPGDDASSGTSSKPRQHPTSPEEEANGKGYTIEELKRLSKPELVELYKTVIPNDLQGNTNTATKENLEMAIFMKQSVALVVQNAKKHERMLGCFFLKPLKDNSSLREGKENENFIREKLPEALEGSGYKVTTSIIEPGLIARKRNGEYCFMATSADGLMSIQKEDHDEFDTPTQTCLEAKTVCTPTTIQAANARVEAVKRHKLPNEDDKHAVFECDAESDLFKKLVWTCSYRAQVIHHCSVLKLSHCVFVCAAKEKILYSVVVHVPRTLRLKYCEFVKSEIAEKYLKFSYDSSEPIPEFTLRAASHATDQHTIQLAFIMRNILIEMITERGMPLPPAEKIVPLVVSLWNQLKVGVDVTSAILEHVNIPFRKMPPMTFLWLRGLDFILLNLHHFSNMLEIHKKQPPWLERLDDLTYREIKNGVSKNRSFGEFLEMVAYCSEELRIVTPTTSENVTPVGTPQPRKYKALPKLSELNCEPLKSLRLNCKRKQSRKSKTSKGVRFQGTKCKLCTTHFYCRDKKGKVSNGHKVGAKTLYVCDCCDIPLCQPSGTYPGCFETFHTTQRLLEPHEYYKRRLKKASGAVPSKAVKFEQFVREYAKLCERAEDRKYPTVDQLNTLRRTYGDFTLEN